MSFLKVKEGVWKSEGGEGGVVKRFVTVCNRGREGGQKLSKTLDVIIEQPLSKFQNAE